MTDSRLSILDAINNGKSKQAIRAMLTLFKLSLVPGPCCSTIAPGDPSLKWLKQGEKLK